MRRTRISETPERIKVSRSGNLKSRATASSKQEPYVMESKNLSRFSKKCQELKENGGSNRVKAKVQETMKILPTSDGKKKRCKRKPAEVEVTVKQLKVAKMNSVPCVSTPSQTVSPQKTLIDISKLAVIIGRTFEKWKLHMKKEGKTTDEEFAEFLLSMYERHVSICMKKERAITQEHKGQQCELLVPNTRLLNEEISIKNEPSSEHERTCPEYRCSYCIKEEQSDDKQQEQAGAENNSENASKIRLKGNRSEPH